MCMHACMCVCVCVCNSGCLISTSGPYMVVWKSECMCTYVYVCVRNVCERMCAGKSLNTHLNNQCDAVCCSVLQCVAVCCNVLQCVAVCCSVLQYVTVCCSVAHLILARV